MGGVEGSIRECILLSTRGASVDTVTARATITGGRRKAVFTVTRNGGKSWRETRCETSMKTRKLER